MRAYQGLPITVNQITVQENQWVKQGQRYPIQAGIEVTAEIISLEAVLTFILRKARLMTDFS